ncbi:hypothetical protein Daura_14405 [Dactylosporangium aurantiacum]|uniref:Uncharacterized protein n=1 Tax=Dactylosporangium aurantiacum TaxID=35754 RepID=A0A9Q9MLS1_9ACTN|nr:hypothetical protein [Dactylosporangium aurantiacum]MDG6108585.1 hypothetical protein [Dactylosporangium aurantiacum]UWZ57251.1 hypothetical protein Daura_14405 [Dactylosporangium aurantiacum]
MSLPVRGPWVVTPTSSTVDWVVAAAALAATADGTAAAVVFGAVPELIDAQAAEVVQLPVGTGLDAVAAVVADLCARHHRVVVLVDAWVVAPPGAGWTAADLATAVRAPVVVVTGTDADATGHTMLFLEALDRRQVPGSVIVVGDGGDFDALPVRLAGRIPADHAAYGDRFATEAAHWVDPLDGRPPAADPRPVKTAGPADPQTRLARRAAWTLAVSFLLALVLLWLCHGYGYSAYT